MRLILSKPARTPSDELRKAMRWAPLERRRKMFWLFLVHRCVTGKAPQCLGESLKTNSEVGNRRTRLPSINSEFFRSSFQFKGSQDWNSLPSGLKVVKSRSTFKTQLKERPYTTTIFYRLVCPCVRVVLCLCWYQFLFL